MHKTNFMQSIDEKYLVVYVLNFCWNVKSLLVGVDPDPAVWSESTLIIYTQYISQ